MCLLYLVLTFMLRSLWRLISGRLMYLILYLNRKRASPWRTTWLTNELIFIPLTLIPHLPILLTTSPIPTPIHNIITRFIPYVAFPLALKLRNITFKVLQPFQVFIIHFFLLDRGFFTGFGIFGLLGVMRGVMGGGRLFIVFL